MRRGKTAAFFLAAGVTTHVAKAVLTALRGRIEAKRQASDQYSRVNVMDLEYMPGDSDWKLVAKIFPYNVTI